MQASFYSTIMISLNYNMYSAMMTAIYLPEYRLYYRQSHAIILWEGDLLSLKAHMELPNYA